MVVTLSAKKKIVLLSLVLLLRAPTAQSTALQWSVSGGPLHSRLTSYLGGSVWGGQIRGLISYEFLSYGEISTGLGFRFDGAESLGLMHLTNPIFLGIKARRYTFGGFLRSGVETSILISSNRGSQFFVPEKSDLNTFQLLWPIQIGASYFGTNEWEFSLTLEMLLGLTPVVQRRFGNSQTRILAPSIQISKAF